MRVKILAFAMLLAGVCLLLVVGYAYNDRSLSPVSLPPIQAERTSFGFADIEPLLSLMDDKATMVADNCKPYLKDGAVVADQYTDCRLNIYWNDRLAVSMRAYIKGHKIALASYSE